MQNEYEAKFLNIGEDEIKSRLKALGATLVKPRQLLTRIIFENDITNANRRWVRLRQEGVKITLTLKQVTSESNIEGTKEVELIVNDLDKTIKFLEGIGMRKRNYQQNYREEWQLGNVICDFDTWPDLPTFLEIEGTNKESVKKVAEQLGLNYNEARFGSVDGIYLKEYGRDILAEDTLLFKND